MNRLCVGVWTHRFHIVGGDEKWWWFNEFKKFVPPMYASLTANMPQLKAKEKLFFFFFFFAQKK
jgi:hypothetical protein